MSLYFIWIRHFSKFRGLTFTRQVNTCIFQSRNGYLPVRAIRRENIKSKPSPKREAALLLIHCLKFNSRCISTSYYGNDDGKSFSQEQRHPPRLSSASQCGSTTDGTTVSLHQRPHERGERMRLVRVLHFLSADWLARLSIARLPGNLNHLLAPSVCHTILLLTSLFFNVIWLQTDCSRRV